MLNLTCVGCDTVYFAKQKRKYCSHDCYSQNGRKGKPLTAEHRTKISSSNLGRNPSIETRAKISAALKGKHKVVKHAKQFKAGSKGAFSGKKHTQETKDKLSVIFKGKKNTSIANEKHWNWKGGVKRQTTSDDHERAKFRQYTQKQVFSRDDYTCQICMKRGGYLQVDHIKKWSDYPELRFDLDNCRTLCMACHYFITFKRNMPEGIIWGHNFSRRIAS